MNSIEKHYPNIRIDKYTIMPNHVHMVIVINGGSSGRPMIAPTVTKYAEKFGGIILREFEQKLKQFLQDNSITAEHFVFEDTCHSVEEAAAAANATAGDLVKSICMVDSEGNLIVAVVSGVDRASTSRVAKALNIETPRTATPEEIVKKTGYPCGGVPAFGYEAIFLIDPKVMGKEFIYTGGGSPYSLTRISTEVLVKINNGQVVRVRK